MTEALIREAQDTLEAAKAGEPMTHFGLIHLLSRIDDYADADTEELLDLRDEVEELRAKLFG